MRPHLKGTQRTWHFGNRGFNPMNTKSSNDSHITDMLHTLNSNIHNMNSKLDLLQQRILHCNDSHSKQLVVVQKNYALLTLMTK